MSNLQVDRRYERKMRVCGVEPTTIQWLLRAHPAHLFVLYPPRHINNLYLDTSSFAYFSDHLNGVSIRKKVRIRWYGDLKGRGEPAQLEIKSKAGWGISKHVYPIRAAGLSDLMPNDVLRQTIRDSELPDSVRELLEPLQPALINRYRREYYQTSDRKVRVTIDTDMSFHAGDREANSVSPLFADRGVVVEFKYDGSAQAEGAAVSSHFPFPVSKNSKYVTGVNLLRAA